MEAENRRIPVSRQLALLQVNRSWYYEWLNRGKGEIISHKDLRLMEKIDKIYTRFPYYGVRKITKHLQLVEKETVNHKHIHRLMKKMGIQAIFPKPNLSRPCLNNETYPYLLKGLEIVRPNQVWGTDITYIKLKGGFLYLVVIMDWFSRFVLAHCLSDTLETGFCLEALEKALRIDCPEIHNSDQGVQFTSQEYLNVLKQHPGIQIGMDGRGRAFDNIFTERLWRSVKYEEVYLKDYSSPGEARQSLGEYFQIYNQERLHESLGYKTPKQVFYENMKGGEKDLKNPFLLS